MLRTAPDGHVRNREDQLAAAIRARYSSRVIIYSVSILLEPQNESEWLAWMRSVHIPDVLRTGCFIECSIYKVVEAPANEASYVMQYRCTSLDDYDRYRNNFAAALQKDHTDRFAGRFRASRQILQEVASASP